MKVLLNSKKGITLIALVITIIILILLAGVSIAILGGENGLIEKTKEAGRKQKIAEVEERINLELMNAETDAILRGEQLEVAQRNDIASKYGEVNGDILTTTDGGYEIDLKSLYNKTLSESGSYTAQKQLIEKLQNDLSTAESNLQAAQMSQSEAGAALAELQTNVNNGTVEANKMLKDYTAYKNGAYVTGTIESKAAQTYTPGTTDQTITAGQYLSGDQTIKGDANLVANNIKSGVEIFGVTGTAPSETTHTLTKNLAASDTGTIDLGASHSYRYINASAVYNKGKTDTATGVTILTNGAAQGSWEAAGSEVSKTSSTSVTLTKGYNSYLVVFVYSNPSTVSPSISISNSNCSTTQLANYKGNGKNVLILKATLTNASSNGSISASCTCEVNYNKNWGGYYGIVGHSMGL